ncbi:MAG: glycosyltransferase [Bacteroidia bacterium]|nr:glycosyltransferase [Bacteroidia bacterium]
MNKHLHIISFAIPLPANYGGVIDVYNKVRSLSEQGVKVYLHCFQYDRKPAEELKEICEKVHYYKRQNQMRLIFHKYPFIIRSRKSEQLLANLLKDDHPILFVGLHCCYYLQNDGLKERTKVVRAQNVEHKYYKELAKVETKTFRKVFFFNEAMKLNLFEKRLKYADKIIAISPLEYEYYKNKFGEKAEYIAGFHANNEITSKEGKGEYALYHANLSVGENNKAALFLVNEVFNDLDIPLRVAGMKPSDELEKAVLKNKNIELIKNPEKERMNELVENAQVFVLPTFQNTGIKLKLLNSVHTGRHCLVNSPMVLNTGLEELCIIADSASEFKKQVKNLMEKPFDAIEVEKRKRILAENYSNEENAKKLIRLLFDQDN